ncbi:Hsp20/alpha crystallin family protein [Synechococcus sp. Lug-A]|uniref:Hsp20/alpha crystallin family protein n=1 Tax=Synechococcus sp. Lug-A TaxID=2823740 RepID=UPI0020CDDDAE|nr:Hsp20/alpha crystallin family protein [Synechococcus sp. Lug-A]MCP9846960.1 Hsp20/alpha crystallin family protein [Synechococcus sp. Lug-A]
MLTLRQSPFDLFERLEQQVLQAERVPAAEVHENDQAYTIVLELPGVDKGSIDVKATDRTLLVSAERRSDRHAPARAQADANSPASDTAAAPAAATPPAAKASARLAPLHSEFRYGTWSRSFTFPGGLQREGLEAHYRDGLLTITAPKAQTVTTVNVKVEG